MWFGHFGASGHRVLAFCWASAVWASSASVLGLSVRNPKHLKSRVQASQNPGPKMVRATCPDDPGSIGVGSRGWGLNPNSLNP